MIFLNTACVALSEYLQLCLQHNLDEPISHEVKLLSLPAAWGSDRRHKKSSVLFVKVSCCCALTHCPLDDCK